MSIKDWQFILFQYLLPHHALSRLFGRFADVRVPWFKTLVISWFVRRYKVEMHSAQIETLSGYENFNAFFTRCLKAEVRPLDTSPEGIACPADGAISQYGRVENGRVLQAKGHRYNVIELLGGDPVTAGMFAQGTFATIYLSPADYHRVHMPVTGTLREMIHVPGKLFSVNPKTTEHVAQLFARNERVICLFETAHGPMAVVLVGAMIVASIETVWAGRVRPITRFKYDRQGQSSVRLKKGEELGRFSLGSTVIILFGPGMATWPEVLQSGHRVQMGQRLASLRR